ncbi:MAG: radical SAM protein [Anaeroplasmataceae bacterium]|nr:radical SAM protein [Anaeroplasmataceae bacterium]
MDYKNKYVMLQHSTICRKIGNRYFLFNPHFDYSKKKIPEISYKAFMITQLIKTPILISEVFYQAKEFIEEVELYAFIEYLDNNDYAMVWENSHKSSFISDIVKTEWANERTFYGCTFELTPYCNFDCVHCYLEDHHNNEELLSTDAIKQIITKLYDNGLMMIFFSGGDPFTRKDFKEIYVFTRRKGILVEIFTNGSLIDEEWLEIFKEYPPIEVDISLYGSTEELYYQTTRRRNMYNLVIDNIKKMKELGINVSIKSPIFSLLKNDIGNMMELANQLEVPFRFSFAITPTIDNKSKERYQIPAEEVAVLTKKFSDHFQTLKESLEEYERIPKSLTKRKYYCSTGRCSAFIDYKGNICPCIEMRDKGLNIEKYEFSYLWEKIKSFSFEKIKDDEDYKCSNCNLVTLCTSCPAIRERVNGSPLIINPEDCSLAEELYKIIKG